MKTLAKRQPVAVNPNRVRVVFQGIVAVGLIVLCSRLTVPALPVPFTLQTLAIGVVLFSSTRRRAQAIVGTYLILGACGLPVFASGQAGIMAFVGPTGGFLVGFLVAIPIAHAVRANVAKALARWTDTGAVGWTKRGLPLILCAVTYLTVLYACGWTWLMIGCGLDAQSAFDTAIAPFILFDGLKMLLAMTTISVFHPGAINLT